MVYNRSFNQTVDELHAFKATSDRDDRDNSSSKNTSKEEIGLENMAIVGKEWQQTVAEAPYEVTSINADRMYKMPGSRVTVSDMTHGVCRKYWYVYYNFLKLAACAVGAFLCFFVMGGLFTYAGILFVIGMGCYYRAYVQHLETAYSLDLNWGVMLPISAERAYTPMRGVDKGGATEWSGLKRSKK